MQACHRIAHKTLAALKVSPTAASFEKPSIGTEKRLKRNWKQIALRKKNLLFSLWSFQFSSPSCSKAPFLLNGRNRGHCQEKVEHLVLHCLRKYLMLSQTLLPYGQSHERYVVPFLEHRYILMDHTWWLQLHYGLDHLKENENRRPETRESANHRSLLKRTHGLSQSDVQMPQGNPNHITSCPLSCSFLLPFPFSLWKRLIMIGFIFRFLKLRLSKIIVNLKSLVIVTSFLWTHSEWSGANDFISHCASWSYTTRHKQSSNEPCWIWFEIEMTWHFDDCGQCQLTATCSNAQWHCTNLAPIDHQPKWRKP